MPEGLGTDRETGHRIVAAELSKLWRISEENHEPIAELVIGLGLLGIAVDGDGPAIDSSDMIALCKLCGFTQKEHDVPVPEDWVSDPAAYPCDRFRRE